MTLGLIRLETQAQPIQYFSGALDESEKRLGIRRKQHNAGRMRCPSGAPQLVFGLALDCQPALTRDRCFEALLSAIWCAECSVHGLNSSPGCGRKGLFPS